MKAAGLSVACQDQQSVSTTLEDIVELLTSMRAELAACSTQIKTDVTDQLAACRNDIVEISMDLLEGKNESKAAYQGILAAIKQQRGWFSMNGRSAVAQGGTHGNGVTQSLRLDSDDPTIAAATGLHSSPVQPLGQDNLLRADWPMTHHRSLSGDLDMFMAPDLNSEIESLPDEPSTDHFASGVAVPRTALHSKANFKIESMVRSKARSKAKPRAKPKAKPKSKSPTFATDRNLRTRTGSPLYVGHPMDHKRRRGAATKIPRSPLVAPPTVQNASGSESVYESARSEALAVARQSSSPLSSPGAVEEAEVDNGSAMPIDATGDDDNKGAQPEESDPRKLPFDAIIGHRQLRSKGRARPAEYEYIVKWSDYEIYDSTWQRKSDIPSCSYNHTKFLQQCEEQRVRPFGGVMLLLEALKWFDMMGKLRKSKLDLELSAATSFA